MLLSDKCLCCLIFNLLYGNSQHNLNFRDVFACFLCFLVWHALCNIVTETAESGRNERNLNNRGNHHEKVNHNRNHDPDAHSY